MAVQKGSTTLHIELRNRLWVELQALVDAGWSRDLDEIVLEALRRYAESHREERMEEFLREDIEWGLHGIP